MEILSHTYCKDASCAGSKHSLEQINIATCRNVGLVMQNYIELIAGSSDDCRRWYMYLPATTPYFWTLHQLEILESILTSTDEGQDSVSSLSLS